MFCMHGISIRHTANNTNPSSYAQEYRVSVSCYTKRIMVARTPRTHAATVEPASKTVRTPRVPKAKNTPRYADTESPTASAAARNILAEHALFTARMREHTRHEAEPSRYAFPLSPHPLFSRHASHFAQKPFCLPFDSVLATELRASCRPCPWWRCILSIHARRSRRHSRKHCRQHTRPRKRRCGRSTNSLPCHRRCKNSGARRTLQKTHRGRRNTRIHEGGTCRLLSQQRKQNHRRILDCRGRIGFPQLAY